jgi:hypothetical protein
MSYLIRRVIQRRERLPPANVILIFPALAGQRAVDEPDALDPLRNRSQGGAKIGNHSQSGGELLWR